MDDVTGGISLNQVQQIVVAVITVLTPTIIAIIKEFGAKLPPWLQPILAPIVAVILDGLAQVFGIQSPGTAVAALSGLAGVGVREVVDQSKKLKKSMDVSKASDSNRVSKKKI